MNRQYAVSAIVTWAFRRCDVYCCVGYGFTGIVLQQRRVWRHTVQCNCFVNTGVLNCGVLLLYLSGSCLGRKMTPSLDCTGYLFGDRQSALLIVA